VYVLEKKFKIITDCNAFVMTMKKKEIPLRVSRWAMYLQDFDYEIEHRLGSKMRHVEFFSLTNGEFFLIFFLEIIVNSYLNLGKKYPYFKRK